MVEESGGCRRSWGGVGENMQLCNFNLLRSALQAMYAPPRHTTPMGFPSL